MCQLFWELGLQILLWFSEPRRYVFMLVDTATSKSRFAAALQRAVSLSLTISVIPLIGEQCYGLDANEALKERNRHQNFFDISPFNNLVKVVHARPSCNIAIIVFPKSPICTNTASVRLPGVSTLLLLILLSSFLVCHQFCEGDKTQCFNKKDHWKIMAHNAQFFQDMLLTLETYKLVWWNVSKPRLPCNMCSYSLNLKPIWLVKLPLWFWSCAMIKPTDSKLT